MNEFKIGNQWVGDGHPTFVIAEIGNNHNGDINIAKKLIDATNACGWHCAKFQKRSPDISVPEKQKNEPKETPWGPMTYLEYKYKVEFAANEYNSIGRPPSIVKMGDNSDKKSRKTEE